MSRSENPKEAMVAESGRILLDFIKILSPLCLALDARRCLGEPLCLDWDCRFEGSPARRLTRKPTVGSAPAIGMPKADVSLKVVLHGLDRK